MNDEKLEALAREAKRVAHEQDQVGKLHALHGGALTTQVDPHRAYAEAQKRINADAQEQFVALCRELLPLGAVQINCGIFQVTFERQAVPR